jgi:hypothetical protein
LLQKIRNKNSQKIGTRKSEQEKPEAKIGNKEEKQ